MSSFIGNSASEGLAFMTIGAQGKERCPVSSGAAWLADA